MSVVNQSERNGRRPLKVGSGLNRRQSICLRKKNRRPLKVGSGLVKFTTLPTSLRGRRPLKVGSGPFRRTSIRFRGVSRRPLKVGSGLALGAAGKFLKSESPSPQGRVGTLDDVLAAI